MGNSGIWVDTEASEELSDFMASFSLWKSSVIKVSSWGCMKSHAFKNLIKMSSSMLGWRNFVLNDWLVVNNIGVLHLQAESLQESIDYFSIFFMDQVSWNSIRSIGLILWSKIDTETLKEGSDILTSKFSSFWGDCVCVLLHINFRFDWSSKSTLASCMVKCFHEWELL